MRTPLARVRGLGSARAGARDWWAVRLNSVALLVLYVWLGVSLLTLPGLDHEAVTEWLARPIAAVPMLLLVVATFWHIKHGIREVIDDYAHDEGLRFFWIAILNFLVLLGTGLAGFAVLKIAFAGSVA